MIHFGAGKIPLSLRPFLKVSQGYSSFQEDPPITEKANILLRTSRMTQSAEQNKGPEGNHTRFSYAAAFNDHRWVELLLYFLTSGLWSPAPKNDGEPRSAEAAIKSAAERKKLAVLVVIVVIGLATAGWQFLQALQAVDGADGATASAPVDPEQVKADMAQKAVELQKKTAAAANGAPDQAQTESAAPSSEAANSPPAPQTVDKEDGE